MKQYIRRSCGATRVRRARGHGTRRE